MFPSSPIASPRSSTDMASPSKDRIRPANVKPKKPAPITPRRFRKFFTPRPSALKSSRSSKSKQALKDITNSRVNTKNRAPQQPAFGGPLPSSHESPNQTPRGAKKRKLSFSSALCSPRSSPIQRKQCSPSSSQASHTNADQRSGRFKLFAEEDEEFWQGGIPVRHARRSVRGPSALLAARLGSGRSSLTYRRAPDWCEETKNFCTGPDEWHKCLSSNGQNLVLPFCVASCTDNPLIAIGDEEGGIRLLDSSAKVKNGFSHPYLSMKPHDNAVMDLTFSNDHRLLASSSGDQTTRIIDMYSQQEAHCLIGHTSSVKRVQFQPSSNNNVISTCSRDGSIKLWDLRCSGRISDISSLPPSVSLDGEMMPGVNPRACIPWTNNIRDAHTDKHSFAQKPVPFHPRKESYARRDDVSVTSIAFLNCGRDHLLASASEADACIKLWDMRMSYSSRHSKHLPVSTTLAPISHRSHRQFGVTSLSFSPDFTRLYSLCRDHTIYAYSTAHLVLGSDSPELLSPRHIPSRRANNGSNAQGLGPLYGFRHPRLQVGSFYVRLSISFPSPLNPSATPLLAVGSSSNCPILFPTSESYLSSLPRTPIPTSGARAQVYARGSSLLPQRPTITPYDNDDDATPIYTLGTPLIEGHRKEVTGVTWTAGGELVSIGDDFEARCWRENAVEAKALRTSGGRGGRTWMSGWADLEGKSLEEDEDEDEC